MLGFTLSQYTCFKSLVYPLNDGTDQILGRKLHENGLKFEHLTVSMTRLRKWTNALLIEDTRNGDGDILK